MVTLPTTVGTITLSGNILEALADSDDTGLIPDVRALLGTVTITPTVSAPVVALKETPKIAVILSEVTCGFDDRGNLRPPKNGVDGEIDPLGSVSLVAPDQPEALSVYGWTYTLSFNPGKGSKWKKFTVSIGGAPGDAVNLVEEYVKQAASRPGSTSPPLWKIDFEGDPLPEDAVVGDFVLVNDTKTIYKIGADSLTFFTSIGGSGGGGGLTLTDTDARYVQLSQINDPGGVAGLDSNGRITDEMLPVPSVSFQSLVANKLA